MIVSFSGRKGSGKTLLAQVLMERGFIKISFADKLKELVSKLYDWNLDDLQILEKKEELLLEPVQWNIEAESKLAAMISATKRFVAPYKEFKTRREALQYIGSEVLRSYDENFHVNSLREKIEPDKNYVLDDTRFKNEVELLRSLGAICVFIIRPSLWEYSNHQSEISLNRNDFEYIIINNRGIKTFLERFSELIKWYGKEQVVSREILCNEVKAISIEECAKNHDCSESHIYRMLQRYGIPFGSEKYFTRNQDAFLSVTPRSAYFAGLLSADGCVLAKIRKSKTATTRLEFASSDLEMVEHFKNWIETTAPIITTDPKNYKTKKTYLSTLKHKYTICTSNALIIEDLKLWCIEPRKSKKNKVPDIIRNNPEMIDYWLIGLIDGDGCVYVKKNKNFTARREIYICVSEEIGLFLQKHYEQFGINSRLYASKVSIGLYRLYFSSHDFDNLVDRLDYSFGLKRKWDKAHETMLLAFI